MIGVKSLCLWFFLIASIENLYNPILQVRKAKLRKCNSFASIFIANEQESQDLGSCLRDLKVCSLTSSSLPSTILWAFVLGAGERRECLMEFYDRALENGSDFNKQIGTKKHFLSKIAKFMRQSSSL